LDRGAGSAVILWCCPSFLPYRFCLFSKLRIKVWNSGGCGKTLGLGIHAGSLAFHMSVCVEAVLQMQRKGQPFLPIYRYITIANDIRPPPPGQRVNKSRREAGESADFFGIHLDVHVNHGAALPCHNAASVDEWSPPDTHCL
jgi:hypothetical protein